MVFFNTSGLIGATVENFTNQVTGSLFLTLLLIIIMFFVFVMVFRIPLELGFSFILPLLIVIMAYTSEFLIFGGLIAIILGFAVAYWFIGR